MALFDRAEPRDFADILEFLGRFTKDDLLQQAAQVDPGLDQRTLAQMLRSLTRFSDQDPPTPETRIPALRDFFATWAKDLEE